MESLPHELIQRIIDIYLENKNSTTDVHSNLFHLLKLANINQTFRKLIYSKSSYWRFINIEPILAVQNNNYHSKTGIYFKFEPIFKTILTKSINVTQLDRIIELSFISIDFLTIETIPTILNHCRQLKELAFPNQSRIYLPKLVDRLVEWWNDELLIDENFILAIEGMQFENCGKNTIELYDQKEFEMFWNDSQKLRDSLKKLTELFYTASPNFCETNPTLCSDCFEKSIHGTHLGIHCTFCSEFIQIMCVDCETNHYQFCVLCIENFNPLNYNLNYAHLDCLENSGKSRIYWICEDCDN
ncbi:hypothetical protein BC833DRAFT_601621 [Globomyces pollinis-pini]|nr:hypothetical protein BC833DRAFT_601621 [Globomyces pollinis-pini]